MSLEKENAILNLNVGILGHIDSGKTSLAKALSTLHSTAAFDKSPQSKERGITLDLGFSAFLVDTPSHLDIPHEKIQFTLVDCPGHASLIRTIIGGAQIMDMMILVIDATKGIQTQTAEGLVIGEITTEKLIVVLNKIDLFPAEGREEQVAKVRQRLEKVFSQTKFRSPPMISLSVAPQGKPQGISDLISALLGNIQLPKRDPSGPFLFSIDHCFSIKGQGTVLTGTVLRGTVKVNDMIELPTFKLNRKVKSLQMFRRPVEKAHQGDRLGLCVTQLDASLVERGWASSLGYIPLVRSAVLSAYKIRFFKGTPASYSKLHITVGHNTVMATCIFFGLPGETSSGTSGTSGEKGTSKEEGISEEEKGASKEEGISKEEKGGSKGISKEELKAPLASKDVLNEPFDFSKEYSFQEELFPTSEAHPLGSQWALLLFETPVLCPPHSIIIGSKLDTDILFSGTLLEVIEPPSSSQTNFPVKIFKKKYKEGDIDRVMDDHTIIGKNLFKKETDMNLFLGLKLERSTGQVGVIESSFGKSGKFKVHFPGGGQKTTEGKLALHFKRFLFSKDKKLTQ